MILIDTSAWIAFFRDQEPLSSSVDALLEDNQAALCDPIRMELTRGFRNVNERDRVLSLMQGCESLSQPEALWDDAGEYGFNLRRKGISPKSMDLLIACYAIAHGTPILAADSDFRKMAEAGVPIRLFE